MCMLLGMSKQLVYVFPGFYNKETILLTTMTLYFMTQGTNWDNNTKTQILETGGKDYLQPVLM